MNGTLKRKKKSLSKEGKKAVFQHDGGELTKDSIVKTPFSEFGLYLNTLLHKRLLYINHLRILSLSLCSASDEKANCLIHISSLVRCRGYTL